MIVTGNTLSSLAHLGSERVGQFMGEEPSGRGYDEIALDANGQPHNPMINRFRKYFKSLERNSENIANFEVARSSLPQCCSTWSSLSCRPARSLSLSRTTSKGWPVGCLSASRTRWEDQLSSNCESLPDLLVREGVFGSEPRPCLLHEREQMLPKVSKFPLLGVSLKSQGAQHHQGLCRHQDNPRLLLSTLLPRDDHGEHVSQEKT